MTRRPRIPSDVLRNLWGQLSDTFRRHQPESQADVDRQGQIIEGAYNSIAANLDNARAAKILAPAMDQLEQNAKSGGWKIPERLLPIVDDCRRAREIGQ